MDADNDLLFEPEIDTPEVIMRTLALMLLLALAACGPLPTPPPAVPAPVATTPPPPPAPPSYCQSKCADDLARCRDTPEHPCGTVQQCLSSCREPS